MRVDEMEHELVLPVHDLSQKGLSTEIVTRLALLLKETALNDRLGGDTCVIEARNEQGRLSQHAVPEHLLLDDTRGKSVGLTSVSSRLG
jgi:hypothetical protein